MQITVNNYLYGKIKQRFPESILDDIKKDKNYHTLTLKEDRDLLKFVEKYRIELDN